MPLQSVLSAPVFSRGRLVTAVLSLIAVTLSDANYRCGLLANLAALLPELRTHDRVIT